MSNYVFIDADSPHEAVAKAESRSGTSFAIEVRQLDERNHDVAVDSVLSPCVTCKAVILASDESAGEPAARLCGRCAIAEFERGQA
jgi:hypothetical protein